MLPLRPGVPDRQTHDYVRPGTTTLYAALRVLDGVVIGECRRRHRSQEFIQFLRRLERATPPDQPLHLILDHLECAQASARAAVADPPPPRTLSLRADQQLLAASGGNAGSRRSPARASGAAPLPACRRSSELFTNT